MNKLINSALGLLGTLGIILLGHPVFAQSPPSTRVVDRIVAVVNDQAITQSELDMFTARSQLDLDLPTPISSQPGRSEREALNHLIERKLQVQLARQSGIRVGAEEVDRFMDEIARGNGLGSGTHLKISLEGVGLTLDQYRKDLEDQLMILKLAGREVKSGILISDEEIQKYYDRHLDEFKEPDRIYLKQIFWPVQDSTHMEAVMAQARKVQNEFSGFGSLEPLNLNPNQISDLGWIEKDQLMPEIAREVSHLSPGKMSNPIRTESGVHLFLINAERKNEHRPLKSVRASIHDELFQEQVTERYLSWARELRNRSHVEIVY